MLQVVTEMRDGQQNSGLHHQINGGKDSNYLVRSWASSLGTVTQGHKVPKSDYRSKWLHRLNRVELMQNVEVQQTLRNVMSILRERDELLQDADSVYEFAERRRIQKCHETVCKIRAESELNKKLSNLPTKYDDGLEIKPSHERGNDRKINKHKKKLPVTSLEDKAKANRKSTNNTTITHSVNLDDIHKTFTQQAKEDTNNNEKLSINQAETPGERKAFLPPIPEKLTFNKEKNKHNDHCLPNLDTESTFSILKRAQELRIERGVAQVNTQNLSLMSSKLQRKYLEARKISQKIDIFGDNRKTLAAEESKTDRNETKRATLPFLDSKSFSEIDCNDFLNLENRLDSLSPTQAVLDHKLYWPTKTKNTFK